MITRLMAAAAFVVAAGTTQAAAEGCGGAYAVQPGDTLSQIADVNYKDARKWSVIYNANLGLIGDSPDKIQVGHTYNLPCIGGLPTGLGTISDVELTSAVTPAAPKAALQTSGPLVAIKLLTADDFAPFTDRDLPEGGLLAEVVEKAMGAVQPKENYQVLWVNDWAAHLDPLLSNAILDLGFPWYQPDCAQNPTEWRCENFHFSAPMFENLIMLFTAKGEPFLFRSDQDILGKTLCRPSGWFTHDLNKNGRNWVSEGKITLVQPNSIADCFELLAAGEVDAVTMNEFSGRGAIKDLGLEEDVVIQKRPLSIEGLHVVVHKTHPQAEELLALINDGLERIKGDGSYQQVIDSHLSRIWDEL